jgi:hypothetical protein
MKGQKNDPLNNQIEKFSYSTQNFYIDILTRSRTYGVGIGEAEGDGDGSRDSTDWVITTTASMSKSSAGGIGQIAANSGGTWSWILAVII